MSAETLMLDITNAASRPNPYPLFARARELGICRQHDGTYVVSRHFDVTALLHDPRVSSDPSNQPNPPPQPAASPFIAQDAPNHDRLRRIAMSEFGPPGHPSLVLEREPEIAARIDGLLAELAGRTQFDVVDDFAYPLPVAVICRLLGVPEEDQPKFQVWADGLVRSAGAQDQADAEELLKVRQNITLEVGLYLLNLIGRHREDPSDNMLSRLANAPEDRRMEDTDLIATGVLLLVAGHETTVNLIANGALTMLRNPELGERLRAEPSIAPRFVEELLRMEPPVQYLPNRVALTDIDVGGTTIPKGARIVLLLSAASRDPDRFPDPDTFDPDRPNNQHFGFGGGIHYCFGAPLARLEGQLGLVTLAGVLDGARLVGDPPPYRPSPVLRGPLHLPVELAQPISGS
jgi:cytochrome P450